MTKESLLALQNIDCNCNNCKHMQRDSEKYQYWHDYWKNEALVGFEGERDKIIEDANNQENEQAKRTLLSKANKMKFQFDKSKLLNYGKCSKFNKDVSFIPGTCQLETQECFENRNQM